MKSLALAISGILVCVVGAPSAAGGGAPEETLARMLVRLAADSRGPRGEVALKQLRRMAEQGKVDADILKPLTGLAAPLWPCCGSYYRTFASAGPRMERILLDRVEQERRYHLLAALALAEHPSPEVTKHLAEMAESGEVPGNVRGQFAVALAARGDQTRNWLREVAERVSHARETEEGPDGEGLLHTLIVAAPRVRATPALLTALWRIIERDRLETWLSLQALIAYSKLKPPPLDAHSADELRTIAAGSSDQAWLCAEVFSHLALARLRVDTASEAEAALCAWVRLESLTGRATWERLRYAADTMIDNVIVGQMERVLSEGSRAAKLGGARLAAFMGPDAERMLPVLERLAAEPDEELTQWARVARVTAAGLTQDGGWVLGEDIEELGRAYRDWLSCSDE